MTTHRALAAGALALGLAAAAAGEPARNGGRVDLGGLAADIAGERDHISAITLAQWIRHQRPDLTVIDLRAAAEYEELHVPTAVNMSVEQASALDEPLETPVVLYSEGGTHAAQVWFILRARGYRNVYFLREGMYEWVSRVLSPQLPIDATPAEQAAYAEDAELSRYFGGMPRRDVARSELHQGYWLNGGDHHDGSRSDVVENVRRRGC